MFTAATYSFGPWFALFVLIVYGMLACLGDIITTMIGLTANKGFQEGNPLARWMFSKFGQSLSGWMTTVFFMLSAAGIASVNYKVGVVYAAAVAASETYFTLRNYFLLKKLGIPVK